jgi:hypothetical protein
VITSTAVMISAFNFFNLIESIINR